VLDVFTDSYFSPESVSLGRLVLNKRAPNEDFVVLPENAKLKPSDIEASPFEDVHVTSRNDGGCKFDFAATKVVTFHHENSSKPTSDEQPTDDMTTSKIVVYKILNSGNIFDEITKDDASKRWIEKHMVRSKKAFIYLRTVCYMSQQFYCASTRLRGTFCPRLSGRKSHVLFSFKLPLEM